MAVALGFVVASGYLLLGRRPVRLHGAGWRWTARTWRSAAFLTALLLVALLSGPLDEAAHGTFWLRTAQTMALLMVAGPLLVLGAPGARISRQRRRGISTPRARRRTVAAFFLFSGVLLGAFLPPVYRLTSSGLPHQLAEVVLVMSAYAFWSQVISQPGRPVFLSHIGRAAYLFASSTQVRILGLFIGFSTVRLYGVPLVDQQIAAGILMVPGVLSDLIVLAACIYLWLAQEERRQRDGTDKDGRRAPLPGSYSREPLSAARPVA